MVQPNKKSQTWLSISKQTSSINDHLDTLGQYTILFGIGTHNSSSYRMFHQKFSQNYLIYLELFTSNKALNFQCTNCQWFIELKITLFLALLNFIQILILLSVFPFLAFALLILKTEAVMQQQKKKLTTQPSLLLLIYFVAYLFSQLNQSLVQLQFPLKS
ncbi:unnamed protein product [Paramecium sonneborni]|uniref:Transmembrane protein n=1 Tax=Paramecium sonneborni TaxID=65129 RepID=A0A8S1PIA4_9CILI|nr:unnamed protein product [Paramecium sonneborni]